MAFNTWSASYALMHVLEGLHGSDRYDLAILDRGLFDALAWFELLATRGAISPEDRDNVQSSLQIEQWRTVIDEVFLFRTDPETSLDREHRYKLIREHGQAMNPKFLANLKLAYDSVEEKYSIGFGRFQNGDTSNSAGTSPKSTAGEVAAQIVAILEEDLKSLEPRP